MGRFTEYGLRVLAVVAAGALGIVSVGIGPASADVPSSVHMVQSAQKTVSPEDYAAAFSQFESTDVPRDVRLEGASRIVTFHLVDGFSLTLVDPEVAEGALPVKGEMTPQLSGGTTKAGIYIGFSQFDQNTLSNALLAAGIGAAICVIPAVGAAACAVAGIAISVGVSYVHKNGICSNSRTLYWYDTVDRNGAHGSAIQCRSTRPK